MLETRRATWVKECHICLPVIAWWFNATIKIFTFVGFKQFLNYSMINLRLLEECEIKFSALTFAIKSMHFIQSSQIIYRILYYIAIKEFSHALSSYSLIKTYYSRFE